MRISDWSSDVCSSDLVDMATGISRLLGAPPGSAQQPTQVKALVLPRATKEETTEGGDGDRDAQRQQRGRKLGRGVQRRNGRSEERRVGKECGRTCRSRWAPSP